jgi:iron complex transport system permease protein
MIIIIEKSSTIGVFLRSLVSSPPLFFLILLVSCLTILFLNLFFGAVWISPWEWWEYVLGRQVFWWQDLLWEIRTPRLLLVALVGASLAVAGAIMQGLFRNPLADPGLLGVSSGAAVGAVSIIVLGNSLFAEFSIRFGLYALPIAAFLGGSLTLFVIYALSKQNNMSLSIATLLLAGIAINAFNGAILGFLTYIANDQQLRTLTFWSMGSFSHSSWREVTFALPFFALLLLILPFFAKALNAFLLGENEAQAIGFSVERIKHLLLLLVSLLVGIAVALTGIIGFVGLVVPHIIRLVLGADHRYLLPASMLLGATLLLAADVLARLLVAPAELPIGLLTTALGGPFFLWLLWRQQRLYRVF